MFVLSGVLCKASGKTVVGRCVTEGLGGGGSSCLPFCGSGAAQRGRWVKVLSVIIAGQVLVNIKADPTSPRFAT